MVVGAVLDHRGRPLCCEIWPGNTTDVTSLLPIARRLHRRFGVEHVCHMADRGMISKGTLKQLESKGWQYILGARMRRQKEVSEQVLSRAGHYHEVRPEGKQGGPAPLQVKEVYVEQRRYIVCRNEAQARKNRADREAILEGLREKLKQGDKALAGNQGYRKYPKGEGAGFSINPDKIAAEARLDGKWVLRHQHRPEARRGRSQVQMALVGGILLPFHQNVGEHTPGLPPSRRDDSRSHLLLVPRFGAAASVA